MTFLNFSQLSENVFRPNFSGKHFPGNQLNFPLTGMCFSLTNFPNCKQTQESLGNKHGLKIFIEIFFKKY